MRPEDFTINVTFQPYLIPPRGKAFMIDEKFLKGTKMKELTKCVLYGIFDVKKYSFDEDNLLIKTTLVWTPYLRDSETTEEEIRETLEGLYGNENKLIGDFASDTWLGYKVDGNEFGISTRNVEIILKKSRKSPTESATTYRIGTIKKGNDGNDWVVKKSGKNQRWFRTYAAN